VTNTIPRLRVLQLTALAAIYFCSTAFMMQFPRYVLLIGGSAEDVGWLLALGLPPALLLSGRVGDWNRRIGGRLPAIAGCLLVIVCNLLMLTVDRLDWVMVALRLFYAIGHSIVFATLFTQAALMVDHPVQRAKIIGWLAIAIQLGNAAGGTLGELAYLRGTANYWLENVAIASLALILAALWPNRPAPTSAPPSVAAGKVRWPGELWSMAAVGIAFAGLLQFLPAFVEYIGRSGQVAEPFIAAWFITPALLVVAGVRLIGGFYAASLLRPQVLIACHLLLLTTLLLVPDMHNREQAVGLALMFGLGYGWLYPALSTLAFSHAPPEARGKVAGWVVAAFEIGYRGSSVGLGLMITHYGYSAMFYSLVAAYCVLLAIAWRQAQRLTYPLRSRT